MTIAVLPPVPIKNSQINYFVCIRESSFAIAKFWLSKIYRKFDSVYTGLNFALLFQKAIILLINASLETKFL